MEDLSEDDIILLKLDTWLAFLHDNEELVESFFDFIPAPVRILEVELIPYDPHPLYWVTYRNKRFIIYPEDVEEVVGIYAKR